MLRIFINGYEYKFSVVDNLPANIEFIFDDGSKFTGIIEQISKTSNFITIRFSNWKRKNSRLCIKFFNKFGIDLTKDGGAEINDNTYFPNPPAFPIFKNHEGLMTRCLNRLYNIANNTPETEKEDSTKTDIKIFCSKYCISECIDSCPLKKYNK